MFYVTWSHMIGACDVRDDDENFETTTAMHERIAQLKAMPEVLSIHANDGFVTLYEWERT